ARQLTQQHHRRGVAASAGDPRTFSQRPLAAAIHHARGAVIGERMAHEARSQHCVFVGSQLMLHARYLFLLRVSAAYESATAPLHSSTRRGASSTLDAM